MPLKIAETDACKAAGMCPYQMASEGSQSCVDGYAGEYECNNIDQVSIVSLSDLGSAKDGNDIWGWTDPITKHEIAIMCCEDGTSFVDITTPESPVVLGFMPTETTSVIWRDVKVYNNHAFIVSESINHGMQVFDLKNLRALNGTTVETLVPEFVYTEFGSAHNIVINEETGYAYVVGTKTCDGGLHIVNIQDPTNPTYAGCFWQDGYTHDAQCVIYDGPDSEHVGKEICFCYNEDTLTIVDVSDKANMLEISRKHYNGSQYTHQGWLTEDSKYLFMNDELDEVEGTTGGVDDGENTRTLIWNIEDLENPVWENTFFSSLRSIDHNLYVKGNYVYEANYCAGLRILEFHDPIIGPAYLTEVASFDVSPNCNGVEFFGSWSNYPYFESGNIVVSSIERGLFVLKPNLE